MTQIKLNSQYTPWLFPPWAAGMERKEASPDSWQDRKEHSFIYCNTDSRSNFAMIWGRHKEDKVYSSSLVCQLNWKNKWKQ